MARIIKHLAAPKPLADLLAFEAFSSNRPTLVLVDLHAHLAACTGQDPLYNAVALKIAAWDAEEAPTWAEELPSRTAERRAHVLKLLEVDNALETLLDQRFPLKQQSSAAAIHLVRPQWYTAQRQQAHAFYWPAYAEYISEVRGIQGDDLVALDQATTQVVELLADPTHEEPQMTKGLVVGHVQSGKTAHFTGVIAKAIDAGYRLVIVLAGSFDLLRDQTQRRIDMELVGQEQISIPASAIEEGAVQDYSDDPDWPHFITFGERPRPPGASPIHRLTGPTEDFSSLKKGVAALKSERHEPSAEPWAEENLMWATTHLAVIKKHPSRIEKLRRDLATLGAPYLKDIAVLVIDDESDQASINTIDPKKQTDRERKRRTAVNREIVGLLGVLPRAQYVGYTATPFANVLIDPSDAEDLFPHDFIISLDAPENYMGAAVFHSPYPEGVEKRLGPTPYIRDLTEQEPAKADLELRGALDAYLLSAMLKLFRTSVAPNRYRFRHHTMLLHESVSRADHLALSKRVDRAWTAADYYGGTGVERLRALYEEDFLPTSLAMASREVLPHSFADLLPFLAGALSRIEEGPSLVLVVNSDSDEKPDFDKKDVWKIIVGGAKLSRGYTIEGLTVSYFRRRAQHADSLMQMGRWFGFRPGYGDLIRLYIGRKEPGPRGTSVDLFEMFDAAVRDEDAFRAQLRRYGNSPDIPPDERLRPIQVPPLVFASHPQLRPAAKNKMHFASLVGESFGGDWVETTQAPSSPADMRANATLLRSLMEEGWLGERRLRFAREGLGRSQEIATFASLVKNESFVSALESLRWSTPESPLRLQIAYLAGRGPAHHIPGAEQWLLLAPQVRGESEGPEWEVAGSGLHVVKRTRLTAGGRFKAFSDPSHRQGAESLLRLEGFTPMGDLADLTARRSVGICLIYPSRERPVASDPVMPGIAFIPPVTNSPRRLVYSVDGQSGTQVVQASASAPAP